MDENSTLKITLELESAWQERFESYRTERVRKGKRWQHKEVTAYQWTQYGATHLHCVARAEWKRAEFGFWLALEIPLRPEPVEFLGYDQVREIVRSHAPAIFATLKSERQWDLTSRLNIRLPGTPVGGEPTLQEEWAVAAPVAATLDHWVGQLRDCDEKFNRAKRFLLEHLSEHQSYYDDIAGNLHDSARFIDQCEACDASPHQDYLDYFPSHIEQHLNAFLARKQTWSHGFKAAFQSVHGRVYAASFPGVWRGHVPN